MITIEELNVLNVCIEWFLFGKISFLLCTLTLYPAKEVQLELFPGLGIYSGIFAMYIQCALLKEFGTKSIVFYALCILYLLSMATVVSDILAYITSVSNNSSSKNIIFISHNTAARQYTTGSTSNWFRSSVNVISRCDCPNHSNHLL